MSRQPQPYIKAEKIDGELVITVLCGVRNGHIVSARGRAPLGDRAAIRTEVVRCITESRAKFGRQENQADGNS